MFNLNEKQRFSLRKLSVGLASVCIGLSFVNMTSKEVKADTVSVQTSVAETSKNNKVDANADASKEVAKSTNSVDSNKLSPSQTVLNKQVTSNDALKGTDVKQGTQETSVKPASTQEQPAVFNKDTNIKVNSNLNKNTNKQALANSLLKDTTKPETTTLNVAKTPQIPVDAKTIAEDKTENSTVINAISGDVTLYQATDGSIDDSTKINPTDVSNESHLYKSAPSFGFKGKFEVSGADIKKGNSIVLISATTPDNTRHNYWASAGGATINEGHHAGDGNWYVTDNNLGVIGNIVTVRTNDAYTLQLHVTTDKKVAPDTTLSFETSNPYWLIFNGWSSAQAYQGTDSSHPLKQTLEITSGNKKTDYVYKFYGQPASEVDDNFYNHSAYNEFVGNPLYATYHGIDWGMNLPDGEYRKAINNWIKAKGQNFDFEFRPFRRVMQVSGSALSNDQSSFFNNFETYYDYINADGKLMHDARSISWGIPTTTAKDGISATDLLKETPTNSSMISKQSDGNYLISYNIDPQTFIKSISSFQNFKNLIIPPIKASATYNFNSKTDAERQKVIDNTVNYYWNGMNGRGLDYYITPYLKTDLNAHSNIEATDLIPDSSTSGHKIRIWLGGAKSQTGSGIELGYSNTYRFVDDNALGQNIGSPVVYSGKKGDNGKIVMTIPDKYELASGQEMPSTYTITNKDQTIDIHLKHQHTKSATQAPATRTIVVHMPDGTTKTYVQTIGFVNNLDKDLVTNKTTNIYTVDSSKSNVTVNGTVDSSIVAYRKTGNDDATGTNYKFASFVLPKVPGYKAYIKPVSINSNMRLFSVSFMAIPQFKPDVTQKVKPAPAKSTPVELQVPVETHDSLSNYTSTTNDPIPDTRVFNNIESNDLTWQIGNKNLNNNSINVPYYLTNTIYKLRLPRFSNYELHLVKRGTTQDSVSFVYINKQTQLNYVFNLKIQDNKYYLTVDKIDRVNRKILPIKTYNVISYQDLLDIFNKYFK